MPQNKNQDIAQTNETEVTSQQRVISAILETFSDHRLISGDLNEIERSDKLKVALEAAKEIASSLGASDALQTMLAMQMVSIHDLQLKVAAQAWKSSGYPELQQYYVNAAAKLSNVFVNQSNILSRLQGHGGQKIIIERVDVHHGGQAIVGNIEGDKGGEKT